MTIRSDLSVNWSVSPRIITIASPSVEIIMQDLHDTLRSIEATSAAMDETPLVSSGGKEPLEGSEIVGLTVSLLNAKLAFEARSGPSYVQCTASGGNLVAFDALGVNISPIEPTAFTQINRVASSSATLLESGVSGLTAEESTRLTSASNDSAANKIMTRDIWQFKGCDPDNPTAISGDGVTSSIVDVNGKRLTILPDSITRT